jgi:hypothetical protein
MTPIPTSSFPTHKIAVTPTMAALRYVGFMSMNATAASGRRARDVVMRLQPRLMSIWVRTRPISSGWRIRPPMILPGAVSVTSTFVLEKKTTGGRPATLSLGAVARQSDRSREADKAGAGDPPHSLRLRGNGHAV